MVFFVAFLQVVFVLEIARYGYYSSNGGGVQVNNYRGGGGERSSLSSSSTNLGFFSKTSSILQRQHYETTTTNDARQRGKTPFELLWKGDVHGGDPYKFNRIHYVVVHSCNDDISWFDDFVIDSQNDNTGVEDGGQQRRRRMKNRSFVTNPKTDVTIFWNCPDDDAYNERGAGEDGISSSSLSATHGANIIKMASNGGSVFSYYVRYIDEYASKWSDNDIVVFLDGDPSRQSLISSLSGRRMAVAASNVVGSSPLPKLMTRRSLKDMLRIASLSGSACLTQSMGFSDADASAYHDTSSLLNFKIKGLPSLGSWLNDLSLPLPPQPLTPVCYGGWFAIETPLLTAKRRDGQFWSVFESRFGMQSEHHFRYVQRVWAGYFSRPLSQSDVVKMQDYATGVSDDEPFEAALLRHDVITADPQGDYSDVGLPTNNNNNNNNNGMTPVRRRSPKIDIASLWKGDSHKKTIDNNTFRRIIIVVSHCSESLRYLHDFLRGITPSEINIYSKCHITPHDAPPQSKLIKLPNESGASHTFAHWMAHRSLKVNYEDVVVFLGSSGNQGNNEEGGKQMMLRRWGRPRSLGEMLRVASATGFACRLRPERSRDDEREDVSVYHNTTTLLSLDERTMMMGGEEQMGDSLTYGEGRGGTQQQYHGEMRGRRQMRNKRGKQRQKQPIRTMGEWLKAMEIELPQPLTQVCYGDSFAVQGYSLWQMRRPKVWRRLEESLAIKTNDEQNNPDMNNNNRRITDNRAVTTIRKESYFAERVWAGLLSRALKKDEIEEVLQYKTSEIKYDSVYKGVLTREVVV